MLNSLKNLSLAGDSQSNYVWFELGADDGESCFPPATHSIATVEDLTDMLDYGSKDLDSIDDDVDEEQGQTRHSLDDGRPLLRTICTWWIHPKQPTTMTKKTQLRINLL